MMPKHVNEFNQVLICNRLVRKEGKKRGRRGGREEEEKEGRTGEERKDRRGKKELVLSYIWFKKHHMKGSVSLLLFSPSITLSLCYEKSFS